MISVVVPVLARPQNAQAVATSIRENTRGPVEVVFVVSPDDPDEMDACRATGESVITVPWAAGPGDFAKKCNMGFAMTTGEFVFLAADDLAFHAGWDERALECAGDRFAVVGTNDLGNPTVMRGRHSTHSLVRRSYVAEHGLTWDGKPGMVYADAYDHQYVDTELVAVAIDRGVFTFCADSLVEHLHPLWSKSEMDATYRKGMENGLADGKLFRQRRMELSGRDASPWGGDAA